MKKNNPTSILKRLVFPFFVCGLIIIILLKLVENRNIDNLIEGNTKFLIALERQNKLKQIEADIELVDGMIGALIKSGETEQAKDLKLRTERTREELKSFEPIFSSVENLKEIDQMVALIEEKTGMQFNILLALLNKQSGNAEKLFSSARYNDLKDRIVETTNTLAEMQKKSTLETSDSIRDNGQNIHRWSIILNISAIILCLLVCAHILIKKRQSENSENKANTAAKIKENFLANMSHEIRTPLNAILGFTNILNKSNLDEHQQKHVQIIHSSGSNLLAIVNDILDLSKIEAGMMRIEQTPFRVGDVMATVEEMLRPKAKEKNIKLIVKVDEDVPQTLCGDAVRLTQILINLISNSIKFTQEGGVYVKVTPFKSEGETIRLEFLVRDTGIGIPKDKQKFIFDRFEQAEAETTRRFGGTGLGLSIVKHLIELQKGKITLNSQEGAGTIFLVELPYKKTNEEAPSVNLKNKKQNIQNMNNKLNILVAEDNIMNQQLINYLLKNWGFNFDLVFNGAQAVEALSKRNYDIVLMDIQMPEMDGHMATRNIRNVLKSKIPIIAMTAHAMAGEREKCINSGMNDYISKPLNEENLYDIIIKYAQGNDNNQEPMRGDQNVINLEYINKFSKDDKDFKKEIIQEFITRVPDNIFTMEKAIQDNNYSTINRIAHDMKTTIHFMGLTALIGHLLQKIEELSSSNGAMIAIQQMFVDIKSVCLQAVQEAGHLIA